MWVEHLAEHLDLPLVANGADPSVVQGNNFAAGAARVIEDVPVPPLGHDPIASFLRFSTSSANSTRLRRTRCT